MNQEYTIPLFDSVTYQKINSRIGRLQKSLMGKQMGSKSYDRIHASLARAKNLKEKTINFYISDLAIYCVVSGTEPSLFNLEHCNVVPEDPVTLSVLKDNWLKFQKKIGKARRLYKLGDRL